MTPQPHDFKAALEAQTETPFGTHRSGGLDIQRINETIRFALRLAERVCGEPSEGMMKAGLDKWSNLRDMYEAMISQAIAEIGEGK